MEGFMAVKFQGHPIIVKEMTRFMLTERIDPEELTKLTTKFNAQKTSLTAATTKVTELGKTLNELKRVFDNHVTNAFTTLENKVHKT
jgi:hypothetical protein